MSCSATGTPPIYIAIIRNFAVLMNTANTVSSKLYQEGNYTCVATSKYGTDVKRFVIKGGEKIRYFETNTMHTHFGEVLGIRHIIIVRHNNEGRNSWRGRICSHAFFVFLICLICSYENATKCCELM